MKLNGVTKVSIVVWLCCTALAEEPVFFADANLQRVVEHYLLIPDPTPSDMLLLDTLDGIDQGIHNIQGIEHATNLNFLSIRHNRVSDLSPMASLVHLNYLNISKNETISDLTPLAGMFDLDTLDAHVNMIGDLTPLAGLVNMEVLVLRHNQVTNIAPLAGLVKLRNLVLRYNAISDISALENLTNLNKLDINVNQVETINAVASMQKLTVLYAQNNRISDISVLAGHPELHTLILYDNQITDISMISTLPRLLTLDVSENPLDRQAYTQHLYTLKHNNPRLLLRYSPDRQSPKHLSASYDRYHDRIQLDWEPFDQGPDFTSYYRVLRSLSLTGTKVAMCDWQTELSYADLTAIPNLTYVYWLQTSVSTTGDHAGRYSQPREGRRLVASMLSLSSTTGGDVIAPGEGEIAISPGTFVPLEAMVSNKALFRFSHWTGSAVDAGKVADPLSLVTTVQMDGDYTLHAHFESLLDVIEVNGAASHVSREEGTSDYPFHAIQDAIDVATSGSIIDVHAATYLENIAWQGKSLHLRGLVDANLAYPVVDGNQLGPVLHLVDCVGPNNEVGGFVFTGGLDEKGGAVVSQGSVLALHHCLVVGNQATDPNGGVIACEDSQVALTNCTIADNPVGSLGSPIVLQDSEGNVTNCILWNEGESAIQVDANSAVYMAYSNVLQGWPIEGCIQADPLFVQPGVWLESPAKDWVMGDYHLQSRVGRWDMLLQSWQMDAQHSPCVDAGDPLDTVGSESVPHGDVVNLGAYGGRLQASMSE